MFRARLRCHARAYARSAISAGPPSVSEATFLPAKVSKVDVFDWLLKDEACLNRQFLQGHPDLRLAYYRNLEKDERGHHVLLGRAFFGSAGCEGPPGHAHGGSMAAVLDEAMGTVCWDNGHSVLAGEIAVRFCAPLPLDHDASITAEITGVDKRKIFVKATLASVVQKPAAACTTAAEPTVYTMATGTFINMNEKFAAYLEELAPVKRPT